MYGPRVPALFEGDKIVIRHVSDKNHRIAAAIDTSKRFCDHGIVILVPYQKVTNTALRSDWAEFEKLNANLDLKYVLAFLLSKVEAFYFRNKYATESLQGGSSHAYPASIRSLIIKDIELKLQKPIISRVDQIVSLVHDPEYASNISLEAKVKILEQQINEEIYKMYELSPEEIEVIDRI